MIILKNKKLTIEVETSQTKYDSVKITSDRSVETYTSDADGNFSHKGEKILLENFTQDKKRSFYKNLLQNQYSEIENIVILSGAGSSYGIGMTSNKGLIMSGLWDEFEKESPVILKKLIKDTEHPKTEKDLEALLTRAGMINIVTKGTLKDEIEIVRKFIVEKCTLELPPNSPHIKLINKVTLRPQKYPRVKLFTLNYDTLFEQAAREGMFTVIDGFTFSSPREFNGKYFDYDLIETRHNRQDKKDSTIAKLFYLFKMHGSLNWKIENNRIIQSDEKTISNDQRVMIFPQDSKYEHSYEQPYFEMMARFQQALRLENTLIITIGFSFVDKHISSVILESLKQNPSLNLMSVTYPEVISADKIYQKELHDITEIQSRVTLIAETFEDFAKEFPENIAHKRNDLLQELNEGLRNIIAKA